MMVKAFLEDLLEMFNCIFLRSSTLPDRLLATLGITGILVATANVVLTVYWTCVGISPTEGYNTMWGNVMIMLNTVTVTAGAN